jgi:hypothetical protein
MTTLRRRSLVSLAAALTVTLALSGCASAPSSLAADAPAPAEGPSATFRFDNEAHDYVHVYLITPQREWLLGRVEAGARATLRLPDVALTEGGGSVRLAVLVGEHVTQQAAARARAVISIPEAATMIVSQRWTFSNALAQGQLTPLPLGRARAEVGRQ